MKTSSAERCSFHVLYVSSVFSYSVCKLRLRFYLIFKTHGIDLFCMALMCCMLFILASETFSKFDYNHTDVVGACLLNCVRIYMEI